MSGVPYERLQFGPVPKDHDLLLSAIEKNKYIDIKYEYENDILLYVKEKFKNHGSVLISDYAIKSQDGKKLLKEVLFLMITQKTYRWIKH